MKYAARQILCSILSLTATYAVADIRGLVKTTNGESIPGATVALLSLPDSTLVTATMTDHDGRFDLGNLSAESKLLSVNCYGFKGITALAKEGENYITLTPSSTELAEVSVTAEKGTLQAKAGGFTYSPGEMSLKQSNALEALKIMPLLDYDLANDSFSILSKGTSVIYINGKEPKEYPKQIMAMLRTIPPKNIKKVEIITNPGAIVSGSFTGGIINIEMIMPNEGYMGSVSANISSSFNGFLELTPSFFMVCRKENYILQ